MIAMFKKITPVLLLAFVFILNGCKCDDNDVAPPSGLIYSYFPTNVGHEIIYDVSLITKDGFFGTSDTAIYQIKEVVESVFLDNQNRPTQRLERYKRDTPNDPWVINDVWTSNLTATRAEKKEENVTFVKLVFPITSSTNWNGNLLNTLDPQNYEYDNLHQPDVVGGINFDSTLTVIQMDEDNFIEYSFEIEKYAPGIGLIFKEHNFVEKDNSQPPLVGIISQRLYKETIVSWSN